MTQDVKQLRVKIFDELSQIVDPEINTTITELELIDEVDIDDSNVKVDLHLTSPFCPAVFGFKIAQDIHDNLLSIDGISDEIKKYDPIYISVKEEINLDKLINLIKQNLKNKFISSEEIFITRERHRQNLEQCLQNLNSFKNTIFEIPYLTDLLIKNLSPATGEKGIADSNFG